MMSEVSTAYVWVNGQWRGQGHSQAQSHWPSNDRALHYGDGLFETIRFAPDGSIPLWPYHKQRLLQGLCALDFPIDSFQQIEQALAQRPQSPLLAGKLLISRGAGPRGYAPPAEPELLLQWQEFTPPDWGRRLTGAISVCRRAWWPDSAISGWRFSRHWRVSNI